METAPAEVLGGIMSLLLCRVSGSVVTGDLVIHWGSPRTVSGCMSVCRRWNAAFDVRVAVALAVCAIIPHFGWQGDGDDCAYTDFWEDVSLALLFGHRWLRVCGLRCCKVQWDLHMDGVGIVAWTHLSRKDIRMARTELVH